MAERFNYIESQADAEELIAEFGQIGAIPRTTFEPGPNPWTPGGEVTVYHAIKVAVLPIELQDAGRDIGGTLIKSSDAQILGSVLGLTITPTTTDTILVDGAFNGDVYEGGRALTVIRCNTLAPAGTPVMHDIIASA
ncbi:MAG: phage protein [Devosia sp.]|jgi:hypothetical protein|nr:phage protein [Devosia sp.]